MLRKEIILKKILQYTREYSIQGKREFPVGRDCADIMYLAQVRNETVQDGEYYIDPHNFGWSSMKVWCDMAHGGFTVIDPQREVAWLNDLNTYRTNDDFVTPLSGPQSQSPSYFSWKSWLALDKPSTLYRLSPDCKTCNNNNYGQPSAMHHSLDSMAYYMTGDGFSCTYYNNKCPEAGDICRTCDDKFNLNQTNSTCTHWIMPSYYSYRDTCTSYWNMAPSLGTRGKFCLCYKTDTFVNGNPIPPNPGDEKVVPNNTNNLWIIIGSSIGAFLLLVLLAIGLVWYYRKRKEKLGFAKLNENKKEEENSDWRLPEVSVQEYYGNEKKGNFDKFYF